MWLPFRIRRTYYCSKSSAALEQAVLGLLSGGGIPRYRGYYRDGRFLLKGRPLDIVSLNNISAKGIVSTEAINPATVSVSYQPSFSPLFLFAALLLVMLYTGITGSRFTVNHVEVSRSEGMLLFAGVYVLSVGIGSLFTYWSIATVRKRLERELSLQPAASY